MSKDMASNLFWTAFSFWPFYCLSVASFVRRAQNSVNKLRLKMTGVCSIPTMGCWVVFVHAWARWAYYTSVQVTPRPIVSEWVLDERDTRSVAEWVLHEGGTPRGRHVTQSLGERAKRPRTQGKASIIWRDEASWTLKLRSSWRTSSLQNGIWSVGVSDGIQIESKSHPLS